ncbi:MAG: RNA polymerase sigma factor [Saprospiraceae bacterium]|nr:RNA polymerase sigma factor [Saprospiraceae bacterium]
MDQRQSSFLSLYRPVHDRFERFCRARVFGIMDHRDLIHDTLLIAFEKFDRPTCEKAFLSFLCGIALRVLSNHRRKRKEVGFPDGMPEIAGELRSDHSSEVYLLHKALSKLPDAQRESLILFEIAGFSVREIAGIHEVSEPVVRQRLVRGRKKLAQILAPEFSITCKGQES